MIRFPQGKDLRQVAQATAAWRGWSEPSPDARAVPIRRGQRGCRDPRAWPGRGGRRAVAAAFM